MAKNDEISIRSVSITEDNFDDEISYRDDKITAKLSLDIEVDIPVGMWQVSQNAFREAIKNYLLNGDIEVKKDVR